jgi:hypothetical protein
MAIDLFPMKEAEVRDQFPEVYQWIFERVKPERDAKVGRTGDADQYARQWWLFGKPRPELRKAMTGLRRYIATIETAKHRFFVFLDGSILPDNMLVNIALDDAFHLGVLSSRVHVTWLWLPVARWRIARATIKRGALIRFHFRLAQMKLRLAYAN